MNPPSHSTASFFILVLPNANNGFDHCAEQATVRVARALDSEGSILTALREDRDGRHHPALAGDRERES